MQINRMERLTAILLGISLFTVSSGLTSAYLTAKPGDLKNEITVGSVEIRLTEADWRPEEGKNLIPGSRVAKNPAVQNEGRTPAWVFLQMKIPVRTIALVDRQTRRKTAPERTELFSFQMDPGWELLEKGEDGTCVFGYQEAVLPGQRTAELFREVEMVNFLEGELTAGEEIVLPVTAVAIQEHVCPPEAGLTEIYQIWLEQQKEIGYETEEI